MHSLCWADDTTPLPTQVASLMDKYAEYLDDADDASGESTKMMREAMAHTQVN